MSKEEPRDKRHFLERGVEFGRKVAPGMVGGLSGAGVTAVFDGALGGLAGAAVGAITQTLMDLLDRAVSQREDRRQGFAAAYAISVIQRRLKAGDALRSDGFWSPEIANRSQAEQLFEGVLLRCKSEHEEKKLPYIASIFANVAFRSDISGETANYVLERATRLTYRQVCAIAFAHRAEGLCLSISWGKYLGLSGVREREPTLTAELSELGGLVHAIGNSELPPFLEPFGAILFDLMGLDAIPREDLEDLRHRIVALGASH